MSISEDRDSYNMQDLSPLKHIRLVVIIPESHPKPFTWFDKF